MPTLPNLSGREVAKAFGRDGSMVTPSIPDHKELAKGTLRSLIRSSGLTVEAFLELAK